MFDLIVLVGLAVLAIFSVAELRTAYLVNNPDVKLHDSPTLMRSFAVFNLMLFGCPRSFPGIGHVRIRSGVVRTEFSKGMP